MYRDLARIYLWVWYIISSHWYRKCGWQGHQEFPPETIEFPLSKNQTKWPIELWTLKQEMESDDDPATMRESFSLVSLVGKCAWKDAVYYAIWFAFFDNTFWEELLVSLKFVSRHFVSRATKLKIVQKFCLMVEISLSNHVLL